MDDFIAKITSKGQITIPKAIRNNVDMGVGDHVVFHLQGKKIEIEKLITQPRADFDKLSSKIQQAFRENNITNNDIEDAISWSKKQK